jgi:hypothetical protein
LQQSTLFLLASIIAITLHVSAKDYYVSPSGSDSLNNGDLGAPFKTIQKAASIMVAGDICFISGGVYREMVTPANSGTPGAMIAFAAKNGEEAIISGYDTIKGWKNYSGDIYECDEPGFIYQLFVDGVPASEARFPNAGKNLFNPATIPLTMTATSVTSPSLTQPEGFWTGAMVWAMIGLRWVAQTAAISSSSPGMLTIQNSSYPDNSGNGVGFITGVLGALDTAGEWFHKGSTLYYQCLAGDTPDKHCIEARVRDWTFNLARKNYIKVKGIKTIGGGINMNGSNHCCIDKVSMKYLSHFVASSKSWLRHDYTTINDDGVGIGIFGSCDTIKKCDISWSAGDGITLYGDSCVIENCIIHDCNYSGTDCCPISAHGNRNVITHNTVYNGGRGLIFIMAGQNNMVTYNDCSNSGLINWDVGGIYAWGTDGKGTQIAYNWVHDISSGGIDYQTANGIYIDNYCANFIIHHNVVWNCVYNAFNYSRPEKNVWFFNNTAFNCKDIDFSYLPDGSPDTSSGNKMYNNLVSFSIGDFNALEKKNNLILKDLQLADQDNYDFRLKSGSLAIDSGILIPGYTDSFAGNAPDIGAYEFNGLFWKAGADTTDTIPPTIALPNTRASVVGNNTLLRVKGIINRSGIELQFPIAVEGCGELIRVDGKRIVTLFTGKIGKGRRYFVVKGLSSGVYLVKVMNNKNR